MISLVSNDNDSLMTREDVKMKFFYMVIVLRENYDIAF